MLARAESLVLDAGLLPTTSSAAMLTTFQTSTPDARDILVRFWSLLPRLPA